MSQQQPQEHPDALDVSGLYRESTEELGHPETPGTVVLVLVFLAAFAIYYFANWLALADVWHVR